MNLELLIIHCTATPEGRVVTSEDIKRWHLLPVKEGGRGWKQVGYSDMIMLDGSILNLVPYNEDDKVDTWEVTNGVAGINSKARHVVYVGGTDLKLHAKDTRTQAQLSSMEQYVKTIISLHSDIKVGGHNQFDSKKSCPSFYVPAWLRSIGVEEKNIYEINSVNT